MRRSSELARLLAGVSLLATVSACAPNLAQAPVPRPLGDYALEKSLAAPVADWPSDQWWTAYGDPQLDSLVAEALADGPDLRVAEARLRQAEAQVEQTGAANRPQLTGNASVQASRSSLNEGQPDIIKGFLPRDVRAQGRLTADLDWQLDFFGRNRALLAQATSQAEAARADRAAAALQLSTAVAGAYADLVRLYADRDSAADAVRVRESSLKLVGERLQNGLENRGQFSQQNATVPASRQEVAALDREIAASRTQIAALLGKGPDRGLQIVQPTAPRLRAFGLPSTLSADLIGRRPDLTAARLRASAAAEGVKAAKADFYPNIDLSGSFGVQSLGLNLLFQKDSLAGSFGPALRLPIFSGGRLEGAYRGRRAEYDQAVAEYDRTLSQALREVADAISGQRSVAAQLVQARQSLTASEDAYRIAQLRYRGGLSPYLDTLTAETSLLSQRRVVADLGAQQLSLDVALVRALGGGFVAAR